LKGPMKALVTVKYSVILENKTDEEIKAWKASTAIFAFVSLTWLVKVINWYQVERKLRSTNLVPIRSIALYGNEQKSVIQKLSCVKLHL
jgi:hypothetical protein